MFERAFLSVCLVLFVNCTFAANILRQNARPVLAAATGVAATHFGSDYVKHRIDDYVKIELSTLSSPMAPADAAHCKSVLLAKAGKEIDPQVINQIQFSENKFIEASALKWRELSIINLRPSHWFMDLVLGEGDFSQGGFFGLVKCNVNNEFTLLHELWHIHSQGLEKCLDKIRLMATSFAAGSLFYIAKSSTLKSGTKRLMLIPAAAGCCVVTGRLSQYQEECEADDFAIKCLTQHGNIKHLQKMGQKFREHSAWTDNSSSILPIPAFLKIKEHMPLVAQCIHLVDDPHPFSEARAIKCEKAVAELKAAELIKQKNKPTWLQKISGLFKKIKNYTIGAKKSVI